MTIEEMKEYIAAELEDEKKKLLRNEPNHYSYLFMIANDMGLTEPKPAAPAAAEDLPKVGDKILTPRFSTVTIEAVFDTFDDAYRAGYKEPTHYFSKEYGILGKSLDMYHMTFAAFDKKSDWNYKGVRK